MDAIGGNSVSFNEQKFHLGDKTIDKKEMAKAMTELANAGDKEASAIVEQFGSVKELYEAIQNRTEVAIGNSTKMAVGKAVANLFSNLPAEVFKPKPLSKGKWIIKTKALKEACRGNTFNCNKIQTKINNLRAKVEQLGQHYQYGLKNLYAVKKNNSATFSVYHQTVSVLRYDDGQSKAAIRHDAHQLNCLRSLAKDKGNEQARILSKFNEIEKSITK